MLKIQARALCNAVVTFLPTQSMLFISLNPINHGPAVNTRPKPNHGRVGKRLECWTLRLLGWKNPNLNQNWGYSTNWAPHMPCSTGLVSGNVVGGIIFLLWNTDLMHRWADGQLISLNHHPRQWENADYFQSWPGLGTFPSRSICFY